MTDMMVRLADLFDGETHWLLPDVDFVWPVELAVVGWEELESDEELGPYETPDMRATIERPYIHGAGLKDEALEKHLRGQGWAAFSVAMTTLLHVLRGGKDQFQHPRYDGQPDTFSFTFKPSLDGWEGGTL